MSKNQPKERRKQNAITTDVGGGVVRDVLFVGIIMILKFSLSLVNEKIPQQLMINPIFYTPQMEAVSHKE